MNSATKYITIQSMALNLQSSIQNALLTIMTQISQNNIFLYTNPTDFIIEMTSGTDVQIDLFIGEENLLKTLPIRVFVPGFWSSSFKVSRVYKYPGDYVVTAYISNAISSVVLTKEITVMSNVSGLIAELKNSPVIYQQRSNQNYGRAYFQFQYKGKTCAGSHANVSFTVGDINSSSMYGPFWLGMDFIQNISKTPLFFDYLSSGNYNATFDVINAISSDRFILPIKVVEGIQGVALKVIPSYGIPGVNIVLQAFFEKRENLTIEWFIDGKSQGIYQRVCKSF